MKLIKVGSIWMLTALGVVAAVGGMMMTVTAAVAFAALDPSLVAECPDGTWIECGWWWDG
jgi:hypothetical protein